MRLHDSPVLNGKHEALQLQRQRYVKNDFLERLTVEEHLEVRMVGHGHRVLSQRHEVAFFGRIFFRIGVFVQLPVLAPSGDHDPSEVDIE